MTTKVQKLSQGYGYRYSDLSTIHDALEVEKITYYQYVEFVPEAQADYMFTVLKYGDKEPEAPRQGCRIIRGELSGKTNEAQANGSAITYARRYSLLMALGWATDDDDGEALTEDSPQAPTKTYATKGKIDFKEINAKIKAAQSRAEVETIYKSVPEKLQQYFTDNCKKRVEEITQEVLGHA